MALQPKARRQQEAELQTELIKANLVDLSTNNWMSFQSDVTYLHLKPESTAVKNANIIPELLSSKAMIESNSIGLRTLNLGLYQVPGAAQVFQEEAAEAIEIANNECERMGLRGDLQASYKHVKIAFDWNNKARSLQVANTKAQLFTEQLLATGALDRIHSRISRMHSLKKQQRLAAQ